MISICSLIYRSTLFADALWYSLHKFTPHLHDRRARFFFVANDPTPELKKHLISRNYPFVTQINRHFSQNDLYQMGYGYPEYINRVYKGYNRAIIESEEQCVLLNSDMMFSPGWLEGLEKYWTPNTILTSTLVERWQDKFGVDKKNPASYFINADFGSHPKNFKEKEFINFVERNKVNQLRSGRHFACIMLSRSMAINNGLYPEGNVFAEWGYVTNALLTL